MHYPIRVLFMCTGNSARSQMAEGFLRHYGGQDFDAYSAGVEPKANIHPLAIKIMQENGIDISQQAPKTIDSINDKAYDFVVTLCDHARSSCPVFHSESGQPIQVIHWNYTDPAAVEGDEAQQLRAFRNTAIELRERIRLLVTVDRRQLQESGIPVTL